MAASRAYQYAYQKFYEKTERSKAQRDRWKKSDRGRRIIGMTRKYIKSALGMETERRHKQSQRGRDLRAWRRATRAGVPGELREMVVLADRFRRHMRGLP